MRRAIAARSIDELNAASAKMTEMGLGAVGVHVPPHPRPPPSHACTHAPMHPRPLQKTHQQRQYTPCWPAWLV
jgi:hypothetical protein